MYALLVTVLFMIAGQQETWQGKYNVTTWETKEACEAFVNSDAGKTSLDGLKTSVILQTGDTNPQMTPECVKEGDE